MIEMSQELREAVASQHGGTATLAHSVPVVRDIRRPVDMGRRRVFDFEGHQSAVRMRFPA